MADLDDFADSMREIGVRVEKNAPKIARVTAIAVLTGVVFPTPVDTGRARSNWNVSIGAADTEVKQARIPGMGGSTGAANTQAAISEGTSVINQYRGNSSIHLTNNLPYIGRLNDGFSAQAPAGFVQIGIQAGIDAVQRSNILDDD